MLGSRVVLRFLVGVLVVLLVPVVVLGPQAAEAATQTKYGARAAFQTNAVLDIGGINLAPDCAGSAFWVGTYDPDTGQARYSIRYQASCSQWGAGLEFTAPKNPTAVFTGVSDAGEKCQMRGSATRNKSLNGWEESGEVYVGTKTVGTTTGGLTPLEPGLAGLCVPDYIKSDAGFGGGSWSAPLSLGTPPEFTTKTSPHTGTCEKGDIGAMSLYWEPHPTISGMVRPVVRVQAPSGSGVWWTQVNYTGSDSLPGMDKFETDNGRRWAPDPGARVVEAGYISIPIDSYRDKNDPFPIVPRVSGVQLSWKHPTATASNDQQALTSSGKKNNQPYVSSAQPKQYVPMVLSSSTNTYNIGPGQTHKAQCVFYVGDRLWKDDTATWDEPWAAVEPGFGFDQPPPGITQTPRPAPGDLKKPDPGCNFSLSDPSGWAAAGACALVGLFGKMLDLLGQLLKAVLGIPAAILEGLANVFIPDGEVLGKQSTKVRKAWNDSSPGKYAADVTTVLGAVNFTSGGSCAGPSIPIPHGGNIQPLNACGSMSPIADVTRAAVTLFVWLGAVLVAFRLVAASIGVNVEGLGRDAS